MWGKDGKTAHGRFYGKPVREEALECGEQLWWRPPRAAGYNVPMEPRWRPGIWLGRKWGYPAHIVYFAEDEQVHYARAAQRRPAADRWALGAHPYCDGCPSDTPAAGASRCARAHRGVATT